MLDVIPAWRVKVGLIEAVSSVACSDLAFAEVVLPMLDELMESKGKKEFEAALVAQQQILAAHSQLQ